MRTTIHIYDGGTVAAVLIAIDGQKRKIGDKKGTRKGTRFIIRLPTASSQLKYEFDPRFAALLMASPRW